MAIPQVDGATNPRGDGTAIPGGGGAALFQLVVQSLAEESATLRVSKTLL